MRNAGELKLGVEGQIKPGVELWGNVAQRLLGHRRHAWPEGQFLTVVVIQNEAPAGAFFMPGSDMHRECPSSTCLFSRIRIFAAP
ncbi:hypothetical protein [Pantoea sp. Ae16]|uniref:hypothetical protein n=1 Tax=Pantoea sp. Ae16 TaxID=1890373 RepID=UPI00352B822F